MPIHCGDLMRATRILQADGLIGIFRHHICPGAVDIQCLHTPGKCQVVENECRIKPGCFTEEQNKIINQ